jgi:hypothetical protein
VGDPLKMRDERLKKLAIDAFENHVIRDRSERGYFLAQRHKDGGWDQNMCAEVMLGFCRFLYVGGDIDGVVFGYGPHDLRQRIAWIGGHRDVSYYVRQKACIGMGGKGSAVSEVWDRGLAAYAVRDRIADLGEEDECDDLIESVNDVLACINDYSRDTFFEALYSAIPAKHEGFMEDFYDAGMVTAPRVYYCWAAVRKLHHLLLEEERR